MKVNHLYGFCSVEACVKGGNNRNDPSGDFLRVRRPFVDFCFASFSLWISFSTKKFHAPAVAVRERDQSDVCLRHSSHGQQSFCLYCVISQGISRRFMKLHETAWNFMKLHETSWNRSDHTPSPPPQLFYISGFLFIYSGRGSPKYPTNFSLKFRLQGF